VTDNEQENAYQEFEQCCSHREHNDLSNGIGPKRHLLCAKCKAHFYDGKFWSAREWEEWINGEETTA
jgi:hypothetical protein